MYTAYPKRFSSFWIHTAKLPKIKSNLKLLLGSVQSRKSNRVVIVTPLKKAVYPVTRQNIYCFDLVGRVVKAFPSSGNGATHVGSIPAPGILKKPTDFSVSLGFKYIQDAHSNIPLVCIGSIPILGSPRVAQLVEQPAF